MKNKFIILLFFVVTSFSGDIIKNKEDRKGKDYAVFFAVNNYQDNGWEDLPTPISDAKDIAIMLEREYGFITEVIENPTKYDINKKLKALSKRKYKEDSQLLIYFTGHGIFDATPGEKEKGLGYFIPADGKYDDEFRDSYVGYFKLNPIINNNPCKHIMVSIDACYSGSFLKYKNRPDELSQGEKLIRNVMPYTSRIGITSGNLEPVKSGVHFSPFARQFLEALSSSGGNDEILTVTELYSYLENISPRPQRGYFGKHHPASDFLFIKKGKKTPILKNNSDRRVDFVDWENAEQENTISSYQIYLQNHSKGLFTSKARQNIQVLEDEIDWRIAQTIDSESSYKDYINRHPSGQFINQAKSKAESLATNGTFTDSRDGQTYKWIRMKDGKIWMAENLNYRTSNSYCYDNKESNCKQYGRLYTWRVAKNACPEGWQLPTDENWKQLLESIGGGYRYYDNGWRDRGNPEYTHKILTSEGFSALLGGMGTTKVVFQFQDLGIFGIYWSSTMNVSNVAWNYYLAGSGDIGVMYRNYNDKTDALSCRCLRELSD